MKKTPIKTHREAHHSKKKIKVMVMFIFFSLVLIGSVSALGFDNKLTYSENDMKVTFENAFGLPLIGSKLGTAELKSHSSVTEIKGFGFGKEEVTMYYDFDFRELYKNGLGNVEFIDMNTGKEIQKDYSFVEWVVENVSVNDYQEVCIFSVNGTSECNKEISGTHLEERGSWIDYKSRDIPNKNIRIGLKTYVGRDDYVDGVWTIAGKKIKKHVTWTGELANGQVSYWKVDEGSGNLADEQSNNTLTANGILYSEPGATINTANSINFSAGSDTAFNSTPVGMDGNLSGTFWVRADTRTNLDTMVGMVGDSSYSLNVFFRDPTFIELNAHDGTTFTGKADFTPYMNSWTFIYWEMTSSTLKFYINNSLVMDNSSTWSGFGGVGGANNFSIGNDGAVSRDLRGGMDEVGVWNRALTEEEITYLWNEGVYCAYGNDNCPEIIPTINLDSPANNTNFTLTNQIIMNATIFDDNNITNVTLYLDNVGNETNTTSGLNNTVWTFTKNMGQGNFFWTIEACDFEDICINASQRFFTFDTLSPSLDVFFPISRVGFHEINTNLSINWSANDTSLDSCIFDYNGANLTLTCSDNQTEINITNRTDNDFTFWVNDIFGNVNRTFISWEYNIFKYDDSFNSTSFETELNNFTINITYNSTEFTDIETNLYYNSTKYPTTVSAGSGDDINISSTIARLFTAPNVKPFFWNFRLTNTTGIFDFNSSENSQTEQPILLGLCNATLTTHYANFTFKDEGNLSLLNASVPSSTFVYTLGNFTVNKTLTYINNTEAESHTFCLDPPNRTLQTVFSLQYETTGYQQRVVEFAQTWNSTLTTNILYLLSDADGLFVTFQIINTAEQTIENAIINASRIIDSVSTIVGTGLTNAAGTKTFWLNPNFLHTINVFKTGFSQFSTSLFPDQTAFTINLGGTAAGGEEDYTKGITVDIFPKGTLLDPNDSIVFNYTLTSNFFIVDEFSFGIRDEDGNIYANETATTNGGTISTTLNTTDNTTLIMDYNWLISGNYTNNSRTWLIYNDTLDDDWSIGIFFSHLTLYIDDGFFGLDDFGLAIITFLTIFIFTGIMSIRYGLVSPAAVTTLMFTLVLFFDVGLGLMTNLNPIGAVPNFPTIIMGIILAGVLLKDGIR